MESKNKKVFELYNYLDAEGFPNEIINKILEEIPDLEDIGYAGFLEKSWLNKIISGFMLDKNGYNQPYLYKEEYEGRIKLICEETINKCKDYIDEKIHIFLFPTFDKFVVEEMAGTNGFSSWDNVILIFINFVDGWEKSLKESLVHELAHAVSPYYKGGDFSIGYGLVLDGIAEHFKDFIIPGKKSPWTQAISREKSQEILDELKWSGWLELKDFEKYTEVFYGTGKYLNWTGYTIGYHLIEKYLKNKKNIIWYKLLRIDPKEILDDLGN